nr:hypothetical protein [Candidatus Sigynarchaeota archaeon]
MRSLNISEMKVDLETEKMLALTLGFKRNFREAFLGFVFWNILWFIVFILPQLIFVFSVTALVLPWIFFLSLATISVIFPLNQAVFALLARRSLIINKALSTVTISSRFMGSNEPETLAVAIENIRTIHIVRINDESHLLMEFTNGMRPLTIAIAWSYARIPLLKALESRLDGFLHPVNNEASI